MIPARYAAYCPNCGGEVESERLAAGLACARCQPDPAKPPWLGRWPGFSPRRRPSPTGPASSRPTWAPRPGRCSGPGPRGWCRGAPSRCSPPRGSARPPSASSPPSGLPGRGGGATSSSPPASSWPRRRNGSGPWGPPSWPTPGSPRRRRPSSSGERPIGLFTVAFLYKNHARLPRPVDFLFVDDVDSLLKSARNVDRVLELLGFTPEDLEKGLSSSGSGGRTPRRPSGWPKG